MHRLRAHLIAAVLAVLAADPVRAMERPEANLFLMDNGASVSGFSSEFGSGWEASNLTPARTDFDEDGKPVRAFIWSSASMAPFPHWAIIRLDKPTWITTLVFDNFLTDEPDHPGISAREIEIWTGPDERRLTRSAAFQLERNASGQAVRLEPVQTSVVKLVIKSNYGHPWYTELGATQAFDDGSRPQTLAEALAQKGSVDLYGLLFDFGSARLRPESATVLKDIMAWRQAHPDTRLAIEGHTDSVGSDSANASLSTARAEAVAAALRKLGMPPGAVSAEGFGETRPIADNATETGRARNRRVTLRVIDKP